MDHAGVHAEAVAGGDDDVLPDLDGPDLLVEVALLTDDRPGAVLLEHPDGEVLEIRAALLLVHQRLLGAQPPAHAFGHLFEVHFLDTEVGRRRRGSQRLHARRPSSDDERRGHRDDEHGHNDEDRARQVWHECNFDTSLPQ